MSIQGQFRPRHHISAKSACAHKLIVKVAAPALLADDRAHRGVFWQPKRHIFAVIGGELRSPAPLCQNLLAGGLTTI